MPMRRKPTGLVGSATPAPTLPESGYSTISAPRLTGHTTGHADFPASGSRIRPHAFAHGTSRPSRVRRTSPKERDRGRKLARLRRGFCFALRAPVDGLVKPSCLGYD